MPSKKKIVHWTLDPERGVLKGEKKKTLSQFSETDSQGCINSLNAKVI